MIVSLNLNLLRFFHDTGSRISYKSIYIIPGTCFITALQHFYRIRVGYFISRYLVIYGPA